MSITRVCEDCGAELPTDTTEGLCPRCLLGAATGLSSAGVSPGVSLGGTSGGETPPALAAEDGRATRRQRFGDYELLEEIASGGMGIVYKARQVHLNRIVAIKTLPFGRFTRETFVKRFQAEAETAARLRHPNIVAIHEVGEHEGQPYFSMDYVDGSSLAEVTRDQPLAIPRAVRFMRTIAEAVHYAHGMGILHRDLKPSNILIDRLDQPHITDFGLAKDLKSDNELTLTGQTLGSPNYIPPEQIDGGKGTAGPHSDIYSLGAVLYHLLTGRPPFVGESLTTTLQQVASNDPVAPRLLNPCISRDLETVCLKCLEKEPRKRYRTAQDLADELGRWQKGEPIQARSIGQLEKGWRWCKRRPALAGAIAMICFLSLGLTGGLTALSFRTREARLAQRIGAVHAIHAHFENARALRSSLNAGRRHEALAVLQKARALAPDPVDFQELRDEAIACLILMDLRSGKTWEMGKTHGDANVLFNALQDVYAQIDESHKIALSRVADDSESILLWEPGLTTQGLHAFSPDGRLISAYSEPDVLCIWEIASRRIALRVPGTRAAAFTPDSRFLTVSRANNTLVMISLHTFQEEQIWPMEHHFRGLAFNADGDWFVGLDDENSIVEKRETSSGRLVRSWASPKAPTCIAVSSNGRNVAVGTFEGHIATWNSESGVPIFLTHAHNDLISSISFSHRGDSLASLSWDGVLLLTDAYYGTALVNMPGAGSQIEFRADDRQLACALKEAHFSLIEVSPNSVVETLRSTAERRGARCLSFSHDGRYLAAGEWAGVHIWDIRLRKQAAFIPLADPRSALFSSESRSLITSGEAGLLRWPLVGSAEGQINLVIGPPERLLPETGLLCAVASDDCHRFVVADRRNARALFLDIDSGSSPIALGPHPGAEFVALTSDGRIAATGTESSPEVRVWSTRDGALLTILPAARGARVIFSPDNRLLAVGNEETLLYDTTTWRPALRPQLKGQTQFPTPVAFSSQNGLFVLATHLRDLQLFDQATGQRLAVLSPPRPTTSGLPAFSPDGKLLASLLWNGDIQIWNLHELRRELAKINLDW